MEPLIIRPDQQSFFYRPVLLPYGKGGMTKIKMDLEERLSRTKTEFKESLVRALPQWLRSKLEDDQKPSTSTSIHSSTIQLLLRSPSSSGLVTGTALDRFNWRGRIDFVGQESILENAYFSAVSSHFGYWHDEDVISFIAAELLHRF